jgi:hypothetical protein
VAALLTAGPGVDHLGLELNDEIADAFATRLDGFSARKVD